MIVAHDLMTPSPRCFPMRSGVREAAARMIEDRVHGAPVVNDDGRLAGIVSLVDVTRALLEGRDGPIQAVMSHDPVTASPADGVYELARILVQRDIRRVVIADGDGKPTGIVTPMDVLRAMVNLGQGFRARPDPEEYR